MLLQKIERQLENQLFLKKLIIDLAQGRKNAGLGRELQI